MIYQDQCHGVARVTIELLRNLPEELPTRVVLIAAEGRTTRFELDGLPPAVEVRYTSSAVSRPHQLRDLLGQLRDINAGVLFAPYHPLAPLRVSCPLVAGVHDCILESDHRLAGGKARSLAYRANTVRVMRQATALIVPSEATRGTLPTFYSHVPPTVVCGNGVDPSVWEASEEEAALVRKQLDLPDRFVLHVGARRPHKNQSLLVRALAHMPDDLHLVMLGHHDPRVTDTLDNLARDLGVSQRVRALDDLPDSTLRGLYGCATVFAFPSLAEGFGLPPLEAMSAGIPVVASAIPAVAEVCRDAAVYVSPFSPLHWAEALTAVAASDSIRSDLRRKGYAVAAATSWQDGAHKMYELLSGLAQGSSVQSLVT